MEHSHRFTLVSAHGREALALTDAFRTQLERKKVCSPQVADASDSVCPGSIRIDDATDIDLLLEAFVTLLRSRMGREALELGDG